MEDSKIKKVEIIAICDKVAKIYEASRYLYEAQENKLVPGAILIRGIESAAQAVLEDLQRHLKEDNVIYVTTDKWQIALNDAYLGLDWVNRARLLVYAGELREASAP